MQHALQLEGQLSHVYQIADVHLAVSQKYIIPGINLMERMSHIGGSEYESRKHAVECWCIGAKAEIDMIASNVRASPLKMKARKNIVLLTHALLCAEEGMRNK